MGSRPKRIDREHSYHHVASRGTDQWNIFLDDSDRVKFLHLLSRVCHKYGIKVIAYCLMGNHFHLVLHIPHGGMSNALRDLKSSYATYFNSRHQRTGPLFRDRFLSVTITDEKHLADATRYTHRNPLDLDPTICLATYAYSSHGIYLGLRPAPWWLTYTEVMGFFGARYQHEIATPRPNDKVQNKAVSIVHAPGARTIDEVPALSEIRRVVAHTAGCQVLEVRPRSHNGLIGIAVVLATDLTGLPARALAEPFGFASAAAVTKQLQRTRKRIETDHQSARLVDACAARLTRKAA